MSDAPDGEEPANDEPPLPTAFTISTIATTTIASTTATQMHSKHAPTTPPAMMPTNISGKPPPPPPPPPLVLLPLDCADDDSISDGVCPLLTELAELAHSGAPSDASTISISVRHAAESDADTVTVTTVSAESLLSVEMVPIWDALTPAMSAIVVRSAF